MLAQVRATGFQRVHVFRLQFGGRHAAVIFKRAHRRDKHRAGRTEARHTALDVKKLLRAEIRTEARLRDAVIRKLQAETRRTDGITAVRDVRKRSAVHDTGRVFQCLHQIRVAGVLQKSRHRALRAEVARVKRFFVVRITDQDAPEAFLQIRCV